MDRLKLETKLQQLIAEGEKVVATRRGNVGSDRARGVTPQALEEWASSVTATFRVAFGDQSDHYRRAIKLSAETWRFEDAAPRSPSGSSASRAAYPRCGSAPRA